MEAALWLALNDLQDGVDSTQKTASGGCQLGARDAFIGTY